MQRHGTRRATAHRAIGTACILILLLAAAATGLADPAQSPPSSPPEAAAFRVGLAKVDITPDLTERSVPLQGYFARHKKPALSIHDPLYARALVVEGADGARVAIVSTDLCYVHSEIRDRVVRRLARDGFHEHNLLIAATHSHSGFGAYDSRLLADMLFGAYESRNQDLVVLGVAAAVRQASQAMRPARIDSGTTTLAGFNRSRHDPAFDFETGGADKRTFDPDRYPTDRTLTVLRFTTPEGAPLGLLFNFSSHPTVLSPKNMALSAEWPGVACDRIEAAMGPHTVAMFLNGSLGDAAPWPDWDTLDKEWLQMRAYGKRMAEQVIKTTADLAPVTDAVVDGRTVRAEFAQLVLCGLGRMKLTRRSSRIGVKRPDQPLQAVRIGPVILLAVPGEPTTAVGNHLKSLCPKNARCLIVAPANGYLGYFVDSEEYEQGGYAADSCLFGPDAYEKIKEAMARAITRTQ